MNHLCYCGRMLSIVEGSETRDWICNCCFKLISKNIKPYKCQNGSKCLFKRVRNHVYRSCADCVESNDADSSTTDHEASFVYNKFRSILSKIS